MFFKVAHFWPLFIYFRLFNKVDNKQVNKQMFNLIFADDWSRTVDRWNQKQLLYQLSHNHYPILYKCLMRKKFETIVLPSTLFPYSLRRFESFPPILTSGVCKGEFQTVVQMSTTYSNYTLLVFKFQSGNKWSKHFL